MRKCTRVADVGSHSQPKSQAKQAQKFKQKTRQRSKTSGSRVPKAQHAYFRAEGD